MPSQAKLRESISRQIIAALESGALPPWRQPWSNDPAVGPACNVLSRKNYRGVNPLLLACASARHNLHSRYWATFNQWKSLGGRIMRRPDHVPPGEWGTGIIYWSRMTKVEKNDEGEEEEKDIFYMRSYVVYCIDQVEGEHLNHLRVGHSVNNAATPVDTYEEADRVIAATKADIRYGGNQAYYSPSDDFIQMPLRGQFIAGEWYETIFHELCHWSERRLNWKPADGGYALAELVAEIGSCFLAAELGIPTDQTSVNHHSYVASWLRGLQDDHRFIFQASSQASKAADFILSFSRTPVETTEEALAE